VAVLYDNKLFENRILSFCLLSWLHFLRVFSFPLVPQRVSFDIEVYNSWDH